MVADPASCAPSLVGDPLAGAPDHSRVDAIVAFMSSEPTFAILLRGYDRGAVDALVRRIATAGDASTEERARLRDELRDPRLPRAPRGYDSREVDRYLAEAASELS